MVTAGRVVVFLGAPGSGKGTQSAWLSTELAIPTLSTGEVLRAEARRKTPVGFVLQRTLASGSLVSDDVVCGLVGARFRQEIAGNGLILDGFPRTVRQAAYLGELLADLGMRQPTVFHLDVSAPGLLARLSARRQCPVCGQIYNLLSRPSARGSRCERDGARLEQRDDDREDVILRRLEEFQRWSAPLIDYYRDGDCHRIDSDRDCDMISAELREIATASSLTLSA